MAYYYDLTEKEYRRGNPSSCERRRRRNRNAVSPSTAVTVSSSVEAALPPPPYDEVYKPQYDEEKPPSYAEISVVNLESSSNNTSTLRT